MKRFLFRATAFAALLFLLLFALAFPGLGRWLVVEDPLEKADVIYVLSGTMYERPLEAVDLYTAGWAPRVWLSSGVQDWGEVELNERGFKVPREADTQAAVMSRLGVPASAIDIMQNTMDSTADEANALVAAVREHHWSRVIVVTSKQHTRRARMEMRRKSAGSGVTIIMRASKYDRSNVDQWWQKRGTIRFTLFEVQRLVAYWLHLAD